MPRRDETRDDTLRGARPELPDEPGVVVLFAAGKPAATALRFEHGPLELGRDTRDGLLLDDDRASRKHVRISHDGTAFLIEDLGSRNGSFVDGQKLASAVSRPASSLVRIGRSLLWTVPDVGTFLGGRTPSSDAERGLVLGGRLRRAFGEIMLASKAGDTLLVRGESGSGKELAARAFHRAHFGDASDAAFVAVNCAAIPEGLAERLLFGARRGAYSGATADADGYVQAADHGTLFLDEIAELDPLVQAKLLRVLENREVLPLGAVRPRKVTLRICAASHKQLRDEVQAGRFREDLYFRLGRPEVTLPPLRARLDEIAWHIAHELGAIDARLSASVTFVEACALRPWPGNVRELIGEVRRAAHRTLEAGGTTLEPEQLAEEAGVAFAPQPAEAAAPTAAPKARSGMPSADEIARALAEQQGNVRAAARVLGIHRNQLRRWLDKQKRSDGSEESDSSGALSDD